MKNVDLQSLGLAILRIVVGIVFVAHGSQKLFVYGLDGVTAAMAKVGFPLPAVAAVLIIATEFLGGIALLLGLFTRLAAIPIAFAMLVAVLKVHLKGGFFLPTGFEYAFTMCAAALTLALTGPGAFALDNVLSKACARRGQQSAAYEG